MTAPEIPDAAVQALIDRAKLKSGLFAVMLLDEFETLRAGLAAALPLLQDNALKIACDMSETNHELIALNAALLDGARAAKDYRECVDYGGYEAEGQAREKLDKSLAHALVVAAMKASEPLHVDAWRPIDTAPKGEGWFLGSRVGDTIPVVTTWDEEEQCWFSFNRSIEGHRQPYRKWEPTLWQPLPTMRFSSEPGAER